MTEIEAINNRIRNREADVRGSVPHVTQFEWEARGTARHKYIPDNDVATSVWYVDARMWQIEISIGKLVHRYGFAGKLEHALRYADKRISTHLIKQKIL